MLIRFSLEYIKSQILPTFCLHVMRSDQRLTLDHCNQMTHNSRFRYKHWMIRPCQNGTVPPHDPQQDRANKIIPTVKVKRSNLSRYLTGRWTETGSCLIAHSSRGPSAWMKVVQRVLNSTSLQWNLKYLTNLICMQWSSSAALFWQTTPRNFC